ncbi:MAG: YhbY family RNA-binding protein [Deltaproteobacteria bacterium]|nr:YhbY family RNA-binding protein [Deltaproteobacteria bacterium]
MTEKLEGFQRRYLRGLAHKMKPVVFVGQKGLTETLNRSIDDALTAHELIKLKFIDFKEKDDKKEITETIEKAHGCELLGMIGHTAIFFRRHPEEEKRKITVPSR